MSVLDNIFDSLRSMSLLQLLLAFIACTGYALGQGALAGPRVRRAAWSFAALGAFGFAVESSEWMQAAMLVAFAVAGMGIFVAMVWLTSRALDRRRETRPAPLDGLLVEAGSGSGNAPRGGAAQHSGEHAHSL